MPRSAFETSSYLQSPEAEWTDGLFHSFTGPVSVLRAGGSPVRALQGKQGCDKRFYWGEKGKRVMVGANYTLNLCPEVNQSADFYMLGSKDFVQCDSLCPQASRSTLANKPTGTKTVNMSYCSISVEFIATHTEFAGLGSTLLQNILK